MASEPNAPAAAARCGRCGQSWIVYDAVTGEIISEKACFSWWCEECGPKRKAEAMEILRLRIEGWMEDPNASPNFVTLTADPNKLPPFIIRGSREEERYWRALFRNVLRRLNWEDKRAGLARIEWIGVTERGDKTGNWHIHLVTDRMIHVDRWRRACVANGLGHILKAKRLNGARGTAVYLAKYLHKARTLMGRARHELKGLKMLLHSSGCLPSLELWRWLRRKVSKAKRTIEWVRLWWNKDGLKRLRNEMRTNKDRLRTELEANTPGELWVVGRFLTDGGKWVRRVTRRMRRRFATPVPPRPPMQLDLMPGMRAKRVGEEL